MRRGFSLVELIVVIAIISTLAAILLPALEDAIESTRRIACMNNLHQLHITINDYALEFDNILPVAGSDVGNSIYWGQPNQIPSAAEFAKYLGMQINGATYHTMKWESRGYTICPSQQANRGVNSANYDYTFSGMGAHRWYSASFGYAQYSSATQSYKGHQKLFITDNVQTNWCGNPGHVYYPQRFTNHYDSVEGQLGGNGLVGDGSCKWRGIDLFYTNSCSYWPTTKDTWGQRRGNNMAWPFGTGGTVGYNKPVGAATPSSATALKMWGYHY